MKKEIILSASFLALSVVTAFAQEGMAPMGDKRGGEHGEGRPPMMQKMKDMRDSMRGELKEFSDQKRDAWRGLKEGMASSTATGTRKEFMDKMHDARKDFQEDMKGLMASGTNPGWAFGMMKDKMGEKFLRNATATAKIAERLGISTSTLQAKIASGTPLKELIKNNLSKDEIKALFPPVIKERMAPATGFFGKMFGPRKEQVTETINENGEVEEHVENKGNFLRRLIGF